MAEKSRGRSCTWPFNYVSEEVLAEESETSELAISHDVSMSESDAIPQDSFDLDAELHSNEYNDEHLRFLAHNTSADGIWFFLVAIKRLKYSLAQFQKSRICRVMFGEITISTLQDIYLHRMYLMSYYRMSRHYPYPNKEIIEKCLACNATKCGSCECPVLSKSFYVFCRRQCSSKWNCKKCLGFDFTPSHVYFDFFHCERCHEDYLKIKT